MKSNEQKRSRGENHLDGFYIPFPSWAREINSPINAFSRNGFGACLPREEASPSSMRGLDGRLFILNRGTLNPGRMKRCFPTSSSQIWKLKAQTRRDRQVDPERKNEGSFEAREQRAGCCEMYRGSIAGLLYKLYIYSYITTARVLSRRRK